MGFWLVTVVKKQTTIESIGNCLKTQADVLASYQLGLFHVNSPVVCFGLVGTADCGVLKRRESRWVPNAPCATQAILGCGGA